MRRPRDRTRSCYSSERQIGLPGPATLRAAKAFAFLCISFGAAVAAFLPATLEQRIGSFLLFGLLPGAGLYVSGRILIHLLNLGTEICDKLATRRISWLARVLTDRLMWISRPLST